MDNPRGDTGHTLSQTRHSIWRHHLCMQTKGDAGRGGDITIAPHPRPSGQQRRAHSQRNRGCCSHAEAAARLWPGPEASTRVSNANGGPFQGWKLREMGMGRLREREADRSCRLSVCVCVVGNESVATGRRASLCVPGSPVVH